MSKEDFKNINEQLRPYTNELAYHVVGDPLVLSDLNEYLNISYSNDLKVNITTTANNLNTHMYDTLNHKTLKQVNFSINSYHANSHKKTLREYLSPIFDYILWAISKQQNHFINLRIWNLDEDESAKVFNREVFNIANEYFNCALDVEQLYIKRPKNIRIAPKVFFNFDEYFDWPSLNDEVESTKGFCYGLDSHFGILASSKVVPCCLDKDGVVDLGTLQNQSLKDILDSSRVKKIQKGFRNHEVVEELCQKCTYRKRFD